MVLCSENIHNFNFNDKLLTHFCSLLGGGYTVCTFSEPVDIEIEIN